MADETGEATIHCPKCNGPLDDHCSHAQCDWLRCLNKTCNGYGDWDTRWVIPEPSTKAKPA